ncbi:hypothetical protein B0T18DRAFT_244626 [Schizothecium vesticola]|uniref:Uncharacterized protein n=1 Tax=Schizothecium vesticola TaxID=314040 RepID=A0AA40EEC6_9PEZI|nr:hypothetical protein B0T18DRAFT_244626 [Schizothecium vesticola]
MRPLRWTDNGNSLMDHISAIRALLYSTASRNGFRLTHSTARSSSRNAEMRSRGSVSRYMVTGFRTPPSSRCGTTNWPCRSGTGFHRR